MNFSAPFASERRFAFDSGEVTGAVGDSVTVLPVVVAVAALTDLGLSALLLWFGVFQVVWGLWYGAPISVEPMKALAALVIAGSLSVPELAVAGTLAGVVLLGFGAVGALGALADRIDAAVIRGVQLAVALVLAQTGVELGLSAPNIALGAVAVGVVTIALGRPRASALAVLAFGAGLAAIETGVPGVGVPSVASAVQSVNAFGLAVAMPRLITGVSELTTDISGLTIGILELTTEFRPLTTGFFAVAIDGFSLTPSTFALTTDALSATAAQLAMTIGNAAVATSLLMRDLFDAEISPDELARSMGIMNLLAVPLGALPMCHGSGGVAGKHAFGARTASSNVLLGGFYAVAAVGAPAVVAAFPMAALGVVLVLVAVQLGRSSLDTDSLGLTAGVGVLGLVTNVGLAFVVGIVASVLLSRIRSEPTA